jgi:hypothetical protein
MVISIPNENNKESIKARFVLISPWSSMNPTISGILARWHGLRTILSTPHKNEASKATAGLAERASESHVNRSSIIIL